MLVCTWGLSGLLLKPGQADRQFNLVVFVELQQLSCSAGSCSLSLSLLFSFEVVAKRTCNGQTSSMMPC